MAIPGYGDTGGLRHKFTAKERDNESNLDYFGARYFSGAQGRFTSADSINVTWKRLLNPTNTLNKYSYAANNPLLYVDPNGKDVTVFYRAGRGSRDFGHMLVAATNQQTGKVKFLDYYPAGNKGFSGGPGIINQGVTAERLKQHAALTIRTTPEAAQKVIEAIESLEKNVPPYWLPSNNCVDQCIDLLRLAGIDLDPIGLNTPEAVWAQLYGTYSAETLKEGNLHGLYRYKPGVDFGVPFSVLPDKTDPFYNLQILYLIVEQQKKQNEKLPKGRVCVSVGGEQHCWDTE
jgi:RHS repeat-associated protein